MSTPATILFQEGTTSPSPPTSGKILIFAKTDNIFYQMDSSGVETPLVGGGSTTGVDGGGPTTDFGGTDPIDGGTP